MSMEEYLYLRLLPGVLAFLAGSCIGSAALCFLMRHSRGESWMHGRSHCDACGHTLGARDLVPIASFLLSGGRCRYCGAKIPVSCPLSEAAFGTAAVLLTLTALGAFDAAGKWRIAPLIVSITFVLAPLASVVRKNIRKRKVGV